jgi:hypothetical protein
MSKKIPAKLVEALKEIGLTAKESLWDCHGTPVVLHKALEKIASFKRITFSEPTIIHSDPKEKICILNVSGSIGDRSEWSIGEAAPYNNKNSYPYAMAEKRAKDRVILKLIDVAGDVYSEEEADEFKDSKPALQETPTEPIEQKSPPPEMVKVKPKERMPAFEDWYPGQHDKLGATYTTNDLEEWAKENSVIMNFFLKNGSDDQKKQIRVLYTWYSTQKKAAIEQGRTM